MPRLLYAVCLAGAVHAGAQQPLQLAQTGGPRFLAARSIAREATVGDVRNAAVFRRHIALALPGVTLDQALAAIADKSGIKLSYSKAVLPLEQPVSLTTTDITVGGALTAVLYDRGVDVVLASDGVSASIVPRDGDRRGGAPIREQPGTGTIAGRVTDEKTGEALAGVAVAVRGLAVSARTALDGRYMLRAVPVGSAVLTFRRLGYVTVSRPVDVVGDSTAHVDVVLVPSALVLDQVVTTVTGDQQLRTMGNTIGTIRADSLVQTAPVANVGDVLNARVAGVQVLEPGGLTGASPQISIRGVGSLATSSQPLLYVDGVRVSNSFITAAPGGGFSGAAGGRFDDIVPEEIESIEVVKGPSAATLYGTDAANGVIVITTKRGAAGGARWNAYAVGGALTVDPDRFPPNYTGWGHTPSGSVVTDCTLIAVGTNQCVQDSITTFTPLRVPSLTPLGTGNHEEAGLQVSGGSSAARYFGSGSYTSEIGYLKLPNAERPILDSILGEQGVSGEQLHPNAVEKYSGRVNVTTPIGRTGDLSISTGYLSNDSRIPGASGVLGLADGGNGYRDAYDGWAQGLRPYILLGQRQDEDAQHFTGSVTSRLQPVGWLTAHGTAGVDYTSAFLDELIPSGLLFFEPGGSRYNQRATIDLYTVDVGATATARLLPSIQAATSVGAQYNRTNDATTNASATQLLPGSQTVSEGVASGGESAIQNVVAGVYAEERLAFNNRLFLTGAVRVDGANDFGSNYHDAVYPKGSLSWLLSDEPFFPRIPGVTTIRLRAAYGESGTQPGLSLTTLGTFNALASGQTTTGAGLNAVGNPAIEPERQKEVEAGLDVDLVRSRVHLEFTYYSKRNTNALYNVPQASSVGGYNQLVNIGEVWNWGYEGTLTASPIVTRAATWSVSLNSSVNHNQILTLGPNFQSIYGQYGGASFVAGYPAYSFFDLPITGYTKPTSGNILLPGDVTLGKRETYIGPDYPPIQATLATNLSFFHDHISIGAQFDYRGGFKEPDETLISQCFTNCYDIIDPHATLKQQAAALALQNGSFWGFYSDAEFVRFRELSITYNAGEAIARRIAARSLSLTLSARNLALWTRYSGPDPETNSNFSASNFGVGAPAFGPYNDGGLPPASYFLVRINVGY
jgi:TonB-dependent SusC/RagA subfamily outer membrane receptor